MVTLLSVFEGFSKNFSLSVANKRRSRIIEGGEERVFYLSSSVDREIGFGISIVVGFDDDGGSSIFC